LLEKTVTYYNAPNTLFTNWAEKDPEEAASHAVKLPPGFQRDAAIGAIAGVWTKTDLQSALRWAESLADDLAVASSEWSSPIAVIFSDWADEDPEAALHWLEGMPDGSRKTSLLNRINSRVTYQIGDPLFAARVVDMVPPGKPRNDAWGKLINWWSEADRTGAVAWVKTQPGDVQEATIPLLAKNISWDDPAGALELASSLSDKSKEKAMEDVVSGWARNDPAAAAKWAQGQPPKAEYLKGIALGWIFKDLTGATEWVNTVEAGPVKDIVLNEVVKRVQSQNPQVALAWIEGIFDETKRTKAYENLGRSWLINDPGAARAWLENAPVSEEFKNQVLSQLKK
jgi:hypothetical protein